MSPKTLVVPLDGSEYSERALPVAESIAERIGGSLLLLSAKYCGPLHPAEYLEEKAAGCARTPVDLVTTDDGLAENAILEALEHSEDRVVCMTTHGRGRLRWAVLGSVAEDVIRRSDRPALVVGRNCRSDFLEGSSHLVACTEGGEPSPELAPAVEAWAHALGLDIRAATVRHPLDIESAEHVDEILASMIAEFGGMVPVDATVLRSGYPAGAIADYADELPAALVAMNSHARSGFPRLALGSVTMAVLHLASCPILVTHNRA